MLALAKVVLLHVVTKVQKLVPVTIRRLVSREVRCPFIAVCPSLGSNINRVEYVGINIDVLNALAETKNITDFNVEVFKQNGLISGKDRIKILGRGELNKTINVTAHAFSATAKQAIEGKGGIVSVIE